MFPLHFRRHVQYGPPQPPMPWVTIIGGMPEQRDGDVLQLHWRRAEAEPKFCTKKRASRAFMVTTTGARATKNGTAKKRGVVSTTRAPASPASSSASSTTPRSPET